MAFHVVLIVLFGALLHAGWNAVIKAGGNRLYDTILVVSGAALIAILVLPFMTQPAPESWPYIGISAALQVVYFRLVAAAYKVGDMSLAYPVMRGTAPLIVAVASGPLIGEMLPVSQWLGVIAISSGVVFMTLGRRSIKGQGWTLAYALLNAVFIAAYTLIDGIGVRYSGAPVAYTLWVFLLPGLLLTAHILYLDGKLFLRYAAGRYTVILGGGAASLGSYAAALWAMTLAPVASVAALRETSILFAAIIAVTVLREPIGWQRWAATGAIVMGAMLVKSA